MKNIFTEGTLETTMHIPSDILKDGWKKKEWAYNALAAFVRTKHGITGFNVERSHSSNGKVTGTQVTFELSEIMVTYMMVEPNGSRGEVLITKLEDDCLKEGGIMDAVNFIISQERKNGEFRNNPFAALATIDK